jgi:hypothetical protein
MWRPLVFEVGIILAIYDLLCTDAQYLAQKELYSGTKTHKDGKKRKKEVMAG